MGLGIGYMLSVDATRTHNISNVARGDKLFKYCTLDGVGHLVCSRWMSHIQNKYADLQMGLGIRYMLRVDVTRKHNICKVT